MHVEWICVEDDGTRPYGPGISPDQRRPLTLVLGDSVVIDISLINPVGGVMLVAAPDEFIVLNARSLCTPSRQLLTARSVSVAGQKQRITLASDDTRRQTPQRGTFDLWVVRGSARTNLIPLSELVIAGSALGNNYL